MTLLEVQGVRGGYTADVNILLGIDIQIVEGEIVTLAGTNGSGKSTLVKAVMGLLPRWEGTITFNGKDLRTVSSEDRIRTGLSYVPQVANVFASLTVLENLQVVQEVADRKTRIAEMFRLFPALASRQRTRASSLSGGERQQLAIARALRSRPRLVLLDEPTANLSPALVQKVFDLIQGLPKLEVSVFLVEQRARQALAISDRGYIMDNGWVVMSGPAPSLLADERMAELYLGDRA
jgi:branched-chain amino acid transport system ATP-binding protein